MGDDDAGELALIEARVSAQRQALRQAVDDWVQSRREALISVQGLAAVAASAFTLGVALRGRKAKAAAPAGRFPALMALALAAVRIHRAYRQTFPAPVRHKARVRQRTSGVTTAG